MGKPTPNNNKSGRSDDKKISGPADTKRQRTEGGKVAVKPAEQSADAILKELITKYKNLGAATWDYEQMLDHIETELAKSTDKQKFLTFSAIRALGGGRKKNEAGEFVDSDEEDDMDMFEELDDEEMPFGMMPFDEEFEEGEFSDEDEQ